jgi:allantoin racemase
MNPEPDVPIGLRAALNKLLGGAARPDTEVEVRFPAQPLGSKGVASSEFNAGYVACSQQAEREGFDGVLIGGFYIPSVYEARRSCDIPVVGPAESAISLAHVLGAKYAILAFPGPLIRYLIECLIDQSGFRSRAIANPVRFVDYPESDLWKIAEGVDAAPMVQSFLEVAQQAVDDGAEVLIPGCTATSLIHEQLSQTITAGTGAPVLSSVQAELKLAEVLVDYRNNLGCHVSRIGAFFQRS